MIKTLLAIPTEEELSLRFSTEEACQEALATWKWTGGHQCSKCAGKSFTYLATRRTWYCQRCGWQDSATARSIFASTKLPLPLWFKALWIFLHPPSTEVNKPEAWPKTMSAQYLQDRLGLKRYQTAWTWMQKLRGLVAQLELEQFVGPNFHDAVRRVMKAVGTRGRRAWGLRKQPSPRRKWHWRPVACLRMAARKETKHPASGFVSEWLHGLAHPPVSRKHFGRWVAEGLLRCWGQAGIELPAVRWLETEPLPYWKIISRIHPSTRLLTTMEG